MADGRAAEVLLDVAERESAELVVTGRRGLDTLGELVLRASGIASSMTPGDPWS
jgi:nucleotide-binding universal stress UspA family protein